MRGIATAVALCLATPADADWIASPPRGYIDTAEFGEASFDTTYRTPGGIRYRRGLGPGAGITRRAVGWAPNELPIYVETGLDSRGGYLLFSTLLRDREGREACWTEASVEERGAALQARLDREIARWTDHCSTVRTLGAQRVIARWQTARKDISRALARLSAVRRVRYLKEPSESDGRTFGLPSFLPQRIDQPVLDAIADQCGLPRTRLHQQEGGIISFRPLVAGAGESSADDRVNGCILGTIKVLPGYQPAP